LSQGHHGKPWQERIAGVGFRSIAYSILVAVVLILWGLGRRPSVPAGKHS
jgi:hydroxylaminobenzene mutase